MIPVLRILVAVLFGGIAAWFRRYRYDRKEPSIWFFVWLVASAVSYALGAVAYLVADMTISQDFWIASSAVLAASLFLIFGFARSFSVDAGYMLLFWSLPLMFNMALVIVNPEALFFRNGDLWVLKELNTTVAIYIAINGFYAFLALCYAVMLYRTLRSHEQERELHNFRYVLGGLLVLFSFAAIGGWLKASVNPQIPVLEIGSLIGAVIIVRGVTGPIEGLWLKRTQGEL